LAELEVQKYLPSFPYCDKTRPGVKNPTNLWLQKILSDGFYSTL